MSSSSDVNHITNGLNGASLEEEEEIDYTDIEER
jgi:hypothetical protein